MMRFLLFSGSRRLSSSSSSSLFFLAVAATATATATDSAFRCLDLMTEGGGCMNNNHDDEEPEKHHFLQQCQLLVDMGCNNIAITLLEDDDESLSSSASLSSLCPLQFVCKNVVGAISPALPPRYTDRANATREQCTGKLGGSIYGPTINGAIFLASYVCESNGQPPIANIVSADTGVAVDGEVCCGPPPGDRKPSPCPADVNNQDPCMNLQQCQQLMENGCQNILLLDEESACPLQYACGDDDADDADDTADTSGSDPPMRPLFAEREQVTREQCTGTLGGSVVVGDIMGDGALIFLESYVCESSGLPPFANIMLQPQPQQDAQTTTTTASIAIQGEVCCGGGPAAAVDVFLEDPTADEETTTTTADDGSKEAAAAAAAAAASSAESSTETSDGTRSSSNIVAFFSSALNHPLLTTAAAVLLVLVLSSS